MAETPPPTAAPRATVPAATVVIFRRAGGGGAEVLMASRAPKMRFAGGAAVFPGGRVDPADVALAREIAPDLKIADAAARVAAIRETLEEVGLAIALTRPVTAAEAAAARALLLREQALAPVLAQLGWRLDLAALVPFAHWCPDWDGAFDTRFYLADLGTGAVTVAPDTTETTHAFWIGAAEALRRADAGDLRVIFPTRRNLERLAQFGSFAETAAHARATPMPQIIPARSERDGVSFLTIPEGLGYPTTAEALADAQRG